MFLHPFISAYFSCYCIDLPQQHSDASAAGISTILDAGRHLQGEHTML